MLLTLFSIHIVIMFCEIGIRSLTPVYSLTVPLNRTWSSKRFRIIGVLIIDADNDYRLYITNPLYDEFDPDEISALYRAR